jgi:hypothetical protein
MANQEFALAISAVCFGLVIGFFAGYATRAYMSYLRRRGDRGRLALVEASLTALSGAASCARTPLPGAAPQWARPLEAANARWNFDVPDINEP